MRLKCWLSYKGSNYFGYQIQKNDDEKSIQKEIQDVLKKIFSVDIKIVSSGRTDKGVHAINQCFHFDVDKEDIDVDKLKHSLNCLTSEDIYIKSLEIVDENFHARFNVKNKTYRYIINVGEYNPLVNDLVYNLNQKLDIEKMKEASKLFLGEHSFHNFCTNEEDFVRKIYSIDFNIENDYLIIDLCGNGFRRYMVRMIVATLIQVGLGKLLIDEIKKLLTIECLTRVSYKAPSCGLYLYNIVY